MISDFTRLVVVRMEHILKIKLFVEGVKRNIFGFKAADERLQMLK